MLTAISLVLGTRLSHAAVQYTFSNTGASPYSFSFLEETPLTASGSFAFAPFQVAGLSFTQATLTNSGITSCFQFGTAGASLSATPFSCGLSAFAPAGGFQSLFLGGLSLGTFAAFNNASQGAAPAGPDQLTIKNVAAYRYTLSHAGTNPFSVSFLTLGLLNSTGVLDFAPFTAGGLLFDQGDLVQTGGTSCLQFGTPGAVLTATPFTCGLAAFAPECGWQDLFFGATAPGTYTAFNAAMQGGCASAPAPETLTIEFLPGDTVVAAVPEPASSVLFAGGLAFMAGLSLRRRRRS